MRLSWKSNNVREVDVTAQQSAHPVLAASPHLDIEGTDTPVAGSLTMPVEIPLVVDLDGTLLLSDMLIETMSLVTAESPLSALAAVMQLRHGRAALKQALAARTELNVACLPWNDLLIDLITTERARGRRIYLASASDRRVVEQIAGQLALFDGVFASDGHINLKGGVKTDALCAAFGERGFIYAGNDEADFAVWESAASVIVVNASSIIVRRASARWPAALVIPRKPTSARTYLKAIRVHQWLKNILLFVPALAAHRVDLLLYCVAGFLSFSLCASSVYITNDLVDLKRDRLHATKRNRPFAAGTIPLLHGLVMVPTLLGGSILLGLMLWPKFLLVLGAYYLATIAYSLALKRQMILDVVTLACLYGLRLVAGSAGVDVKLSSWLVAFAILIFTSLAVVKRCAELMDRKKVELTDNSGRDYHTTDLPLLESLAAASGFTAVVVFALYMKSVDVALLYSHADRLWLIPIILIYWISRVLLLTHRGEMHDDPVVFAATEPVSLACGACCVAVFAASL
jgi:4-hydroxybenzoate polyprenyltransferase